MGGGRWPQLEELTQRYPQVRFLGAKGQDELPAYYNCADVFVFPSKTDTFGLVLLEAMACGIPVAAYPVEGPIDVVDNGVSGVLRQTSAGLPASPRSWTRKRYAPTPQPLLGGGHPAVPAAPAPGAPGGARHGGCHQAGTRIARPATQFLPSAPPTEAVMPNGIAASAAGLFSLWLTGPVEARFRHRVHVAQVGLASGTEFAKTPKVALHIEFMVTYGRGAQGQTEGMTMGQLLANLQGRSSPCWVCWG
jgi:hypothetical protein